METDNSGYILSIYDKIRCLFIVFMSAETPSRKIDLVDPSTGEVSSCNPELNIHFTEDPREWVDALNLAVEKANDAPIVFTPETHLTTEQAEIWYELQLKGANALTALNALQAYLKINPQLSVRRENWRECFQITETGLDYQSPDRKNVARFNKEMEDITYSNGLLQDFEINIFSPDEFHLLVARLVDRINESNDSNIIIRPLGQSSEVINLTQNIDWNNLHIKVTKYFDFNNVDEAIRIFKKMFSKITAQELDRQTNLVSMGIRNREQYGENSVYLFSLPQRYQLSESMQKAGFSLPSIYHQQESGKEIIVRELMALLPDGFVNQLFEIKSLGALTTQINKIIDPIKWRKWLLKFYLNAVFMQKYSIDEWSVQAYFDISEHVEKVLHDKLGSEDFEDFWKSITSKKSLKTPMLRRLADRWGTDWLDFPKKES